MVASKLVVQAVKEAEKLLPYLSENLGNANAEYMRGDISHGAYSYVLHRHGNASMMLACVNLENGRIEESYFENNIPVDIQDKICNALTWMCHDLKQYVKLDLANNTNRSNDKGIIESGISVIEDSLMELGYTEVSPLFGILTKPRA